MIRLLVVGRNGQLARSLVERGEFHREIDVVALGRPDIDLDVPSGIRVAIQSVRPDIVVNAAAYTAVDKAETDVARSFAVNRDGAAELAFACNAVGAPFVQISTDYVFDGGKKSPYQESDDPNPLNVYGLSKLQGEIEVRAAHPHSVVIRTSWVYSPFATNFVKTMLHLAEIRRTVDVVSDQYGAPTSALDLAEALLRITPRLISGEATGRIFHLAGSGNTTWHGLAGEVFKSAARLGRAVPTVRSISAQEYASLAKRPKYSSLDTSAFVSFFGFELPPWETGVEQTVRRLLSNAGDDSRSL